jgi:hypothetical protein
MINILQTKTNIFLGFGFPGFTVEVLSTNLERKLESVNDHIQPKYKDVEEISENRRGTSSLMNK